MQTRLGADFSEVRVHTDSVARASAAAVGARAYTLGDHVVIGEGGADKHTLAHELTHVIQQSQGPVAGTDHGGGLRISDPSDPFERAAESTATQVMSGSAPSMQAAPPAAAAAGIRHAGHPAQCLLQPQHSVGNRAVAQDPVSNSIQRVRQKNSTDEGDSYETKLMLYNDFKRKGAQLMVNLGQAVADVTRVDKDFSEQFSARYETKSESADIPANVPVDNPSSYKKIETGPKGKNSAYVNYASVADATLIAGWNYAAEDKEGEGARLSNSEILYQQYKSAGGSISTLRQVVRSSIENQDTLKIMDMCTGKKLEKIAGKTYTLGEDDFNALLATDNCKGVAYMLTDHARESGGKTLTSITMYPNRLILEIG
jgi:hypothetical protein